MIGKNISHYKILDKIGEGGMGDVYKARDLKLDRLVALKFITRKMKVDEEAVKRFNHEAKATSALDHVNIATIYEIDETSDGQMFIAMAYYEGFTLREILEQKPIGVDKAVDLAIQIARGLSKAHDGGIVHRDIKPSNIIVTDEGIIKIIDFGLAKLAGSTKITKTGVTTGTAAYMSPEQARGEEVDHRADIFSLGIVIYEMLTGASPFKGEYDLAIMHSILNDEPESMTTHNPEIPERLGEIVYRALAKDIDSRYQDASELAADLNRFKDDLKGEKDSTLKKKKSGKGLRTALIAAAIIAATAAYVIYSHVSDSGGLQSILQRIGIVSDEPAQTVKADYEGLAIAVAPFWGQNEAAAEEGIAVQNLLIRTLNETMSSEGSTNILAVGPDEIPRSHAEAKALGRQLGALMVLWGNVLIYEGEVEIQPYISIAKPLEDPSEAKPLEDPSDSSLKPIKFQLSAQDQLELRKKKASEIGNTTLFAAARYFQERNPGKALSIVQKLPETDSERFILQGNILRDMGESDDAIEAYKMASDLAPGSARPHLSLGTIYHRHLQRFDEALAEFKKAVEVKPDYSWARLRLAEFYNDFDGMEGLALNEIEKVIALGPEDAETYNYIGFLYKGMGMHDSAIDYYKKATTLTPGNARYICSLGSVYESTGEYEKAIEHYRKAIEIAPLDGWPHAALGHCYARQERYEEALEEYEIALALAPDAPGVFSDYNSIGSMHARLGDKKKAVKYFNTAFEKSESFFPWLRYLSLGINYSGVGMYDDAVAEYQKGIAGGYYLEIYHYYSGYTYERMGRYDDALSAYQMGIEAELQDSLKTTIQNHLHYFLTLCRLGRQSEARSFITDFSKKYTDIKGTWTVERELGILDFYSNRIAASDLLEKKKGKYTARRMSPGQCIIDYYVAMSYVIDITAENNITSIDDENAREYLRKFSDCCVDLGDFAFDGRVKMELERLK
jgi:serine/threonine protein kinase/Flp pilus assembly protein TadD